MEQYSLRGIDYIEMYVFNAFQAANFYRSVFGFNIVAYAGPETGMKDQISYFLQQGSIRLLISSTTNQNSPLLKHVINHDESIKDIAITANNVSQLYEIATKAGAISILEPTEINDGKVRMIKATIATFGNTVHSFIERKNPSSHELPFYTPLNYSPNQNPAGLESLDHIAVAIETGGLETWQKFYEDVLEFNVFSAEDIYTNESGMKSVVLNDPTGVIKFVLVEGVSNKKKSQIENYVSYHGCSGVQHLAFSSKDIIQTANLLKNQGIKFLEIPKTYYDNIPLSLKKILQDRLEVMQHLNILVDQEKHGYLMQMFTRPLQNRPTFFIEVIQRENSTGFGSNNIKALYKAVEKDQRRAMIDV
ncbi:MAG: 4-hydroxyphenylpyruvate dioxygenase [Alphaproteobacteria bacterium 41-28]|nr:MAG: 4-hydroxyphenylpyruvate dioxygenase [Alphaproteobacteria bacterium 41-28]